MGEMMKLTFKVRRSGSWRCVEYPEITLRRLERTHSKPFGWAVFDDGREVGVRHLSKALAQNAAVEFLTARETAKAYRPDLDDDPAPVIAPQLHPVGIAGNSPLSRPAEYGRVPAALMGVDTVTAAVAKAVDALKSAVEIAASQAVAAEADETDAELLDRIVRRAKYDALAMVRRVLAGWAEGARSNHEALGHRDDIEGCCLQFAQKDIACMINDAARETGTRSPYGDDEL